MLDLTCQHCKYTWQYKGNAPFYATCPRCLWKVPLPKEDHDESS